MALKIQIITISYCTMSVKILANSEDSAQIDSLVYDTENLEQTIWVKERE